MTILAIVLAILALPVLVFLHFASLARGVPIWLLPSCAISLIALGMLLVAAVGGGR